MFTMTKAGAQRLTRNYCVGKRFMEAATIARAREQAYWMNHIRVMTGAASSPWFPLYPAELQQLVGVTFGPW